MFTARGFFPTSGCAILLFVLGGCTSGQKWVEEAPVPSAASNGTQRAEKHWTQEEAPQPRPRLNRVVTLGKSELPDTPDASSEGSGSSGSSRAPVVVHVENHVTQETYVGGGYGYGPFFPASSGVTRSRPSQRSSGSGVASDWPAVPDHGPTFPYKTTPSDPWAKD